MNGDNFDKNEINENDYVFKTVDVNGKRKTYGWSVAALVCGILSLIFFYFGFSSVVLGICAVVFAIIARKNLGFFDRFCIAGVVLGIIGFVIGVFMILGSIFMEESIVQELQKVLTEIFKMDSAS